MSVPMVERYTARHHPSRDAAALHVHFVSGVYVLGISLTGCYVSIVMWRALQFKIVVRTHLSPVLHTKGCEPSSGQMLLSLNWRV